MQGLAPYWFEVEAAAFVSDDGDVSARIELEYELLLTQRLILQPRTELNFAIQDVPENGVGSGLSTAEAGLRLRYEIKRQFCPTLAFHGSALWAKPPTLSAQKAKIRRAFHLSPA